MSYKPKILAIAGSTRTDSLNKRLARAAAAAAEEAGAQAAFADLRDYPLPLYDGDLEEAEGIPEYARALKRLFIAHDGFLIASPEYNGGYSAVLKNAIDWLSRREEGEAPLAAFKGKTAALLAASPGALGGLRGLIALRTLLSGIGVLVLPQQRALANAAEAFDDDGALVNPKERQQVAEIAAALAKTLRALKQP